MASVEGGAETASLSEEAYPAPGNGTGTDLLSHGWLALQGKTFIIIKPCPSRA